MRTPTIVTTAAFVLIAARLCSAQAEAPSLSPAEIAVACGPPASLAAPSARALRIVGVQDTVRRGVFGERDLLIVGGGTRAGVRTDQQFFVRRAVRVGAQYATAPGMRYGAQSARAEAVVTGGWVRIVAVNEAAAIAVVVRSCGPMFTDDYLEPFVAPSLPAGVDRGDSGGEPDFGSLGRVVSGVENRSTAAPGELIVVDRGTDRGVAAGVRLAIYRDVAAAGMPLMPVGEALILAAGKDRSLARVLSAHDAVLSGDVVVQRK